MRSMRYSLLVLVSLLFIGLLVGCRQSGQISMPASSGELAGSQQVIEAKPHWFACQRHQDCILETGVCGADTAVNRAYQDVFIQFRDSINTLVECVGKPDPETVKPEVACLQNRCVIKAMNAP